MDEIKCPICGKTGIPDYHSQDTVCPCCGADLSIYRLIDSIKEGNDVVNTGSRKWKTACIIALALVCISLVAGLLLFSAKRHSDSEIKQKTEQIAALQSKVDELSGTIEKLSEPSAPENVGFVYTVKNGDSFWKISRLFYGSGNKFQKIAEDNGLTPGSMLHIGDKLVINNLD